MDTRSTSQYLKIKETGLLVVSNMQRLEMSPLTSVCSVCVFVCMDVFLSVLFSSLGVFWGIIWCFFFPLSLFTACSLGVREFISKSIQCLAHSSFLLTFSEDFEADALG